MRHPDGVVDRVEVVLEALVDEVLVVRVAHEAVGARAHRGLVHCGVAAPLRIRLGEDGYVDPGHVEEEEGRVGPEELDLPGAVVHGLAAGPIVRSPDPAARRPAAGVIGRRAAVVIFGGAAHALVAEYQVVGGDGRAVVERRRGDRRPDRDGVDLLRRGDRCHHAVIAGIQLHGRVEDGAVRVVVGLAAATHLIQAAVVADDRGDDRGVQIDLVERPGDGKLGAIGVADGGDGGGGLAGGLGGVLGGSGRDRRGIGRGLGGGGGRSGVLGARLAGGGGGGLGGIGGRLRDGGGARVAGGTGRVGRIACRIGGGLGGSGRLGRVIRFGRFGRHRGGGFGGFGGAARGVGGVAGGLRRGCGVTRRGVDRRRIDRGGLVVVAAADQREAGCSNPSLRAGSQHGAARDLSLSQGGPVVTVAHDKVLSGPRLSRCGTARCTSAPSMAHYRIAPPLVMLSKKEIMGLSTECFGFGRCWNPPLCQSWGSGVRSRAGTPPLRSPLSIASAGEGVRG